MFVGPRLTAPRVEPSVGGGGLEVEGYPFQCEGLTDSPLLM